MFTGLLPGCMPVGVDDTYSLGRTIRARVCGYRVRVRYCLGTRIAETAGVIALGVLLTVAAQLDLRGREDTYLETAGSVLLAGSCLTLLLRHRWPRSVLAVTAVCTAAYLSLGQPGYFIVWPFAIALYTVIVQGRRLLGGVTASLVIAGVFVTSSPHMLDLSGEVDATFWVSLVLGLVILLAENRRRRTAYLQEVEHRMRIAEQASEEIGRRHASEERLRIARELHDSLTHSLSVVNVQAGVAVHLLDKDNARDESACQALGAIKSASQEALRELRATLEALRTPEEQPKPPPSLHRLSEVIEQTRAAGNPVEVAVDGLPDHLPVEVTRTVFHVAQEALTNTVRHVPGARVRVWARADRSHVELSVVDDGSGRRLHHITEGHGLIGMRERVNAVHGELLARPRVNSGFEVLLRLPLGEPSTGPLGLMRG